ncbi:hypothetical protein DH2020_022148 [Rehmannia glutinosa]|uniref:Uncharacterized protein n=1 Tax=Rehmannia glutinosa TaxID=99300 RepID=A0ABR0WCG2_REHGL
MEYERRFNQLSQYAPYLADTEQKKARRFERGLPSISSETEKEPLVPSLVVKKKCFSSHEEEVHCCAKECSCAKEAEDWRKCFHFFMSLRMVCYWASKPITILAKLFKPALFSSVFPYLSAAKLLKSTVQERTDDGDFLNISSILAPRSVSPAKTTSPVCSFASVKLQKYSFSSLNSFSGSFNLSPSRLDCPVRSRTGSMRCSVQATAEELVPGSLLQQFVDGDDEFHNR